MDFITYSIILDDIVFPDGTSVMAVLGGSGPQTAFGMKLWTDSVGLVGGVGHDWPLLPKPGSTQWRLTARASATMPTTSHCAPGK